MTMLFDFPLPASGRVCRECGSPITKKPGPGRWSVYCGDECRNAPRICDLCEESYVPKRAHRPDQRFCSKGCKTAWQNGARPPYQRADRAGRRVALSRARRLRHAQTWDGITDEEILERDGWRCQIPGCKRRPIRKDLRYPHLRSKSIDHIIPLSHGGDDTAENKRAAHLGCNISRNNQMGDEQVALFGVIREPPLVTRMTGTIWLCTCGNAKQRRDSSGCETCQKQWKADAEKRRLEAAQERAQQRAQERHLAAEKRRLKAEQAAALHAEIRKLRAQGFTTRATAAHLGTSQRMVTRVGLADPVTGKLPR